MTSEKELIEAVWLGTMDYQEAFALQKQLSAARLNEQIGDRLLFLEHPAVYTLGKRATESDFVVDRESLIQQGFSIVESSRGGQITYHGPGQLVVYFIVHLYKDSRELRRLVNDIEEAVIALLAKYSIEASIDPDNPGVWVANQKIAAIGLAVHNRITMHGLALNVKPDLSHFNNIIACGIRDRGQTSLAELCKQASHGTDALLPLRTIAHQLARELAQRLNYSQLGWLEDPRGT